MECDYLNGWIKKRSHTQKSHPKVVNPRDIAGERKKKQNKKKHMSGTAKQLLLIPHWSFYRFFVVSLRQTQCFSTFKKNLPKVHLFEVHLCSCVQGCSVSVVQLVCLSVSVCVQACVDVCYGYGSQNDIWYDDVIPRIADVMFQCVCVFLSV